MLSDPAVSHWVPDPETPPELVDETVADLLDAAAAKWPEREALVYSTYEDLGISLQLSFEQLRERAIEIAAALIASGLRAGDRVVVWATNVPQFPLLQFACAYANLIMVPINPLYRRDDLGYVLDKVEANAIFLVPFDRGVHLWKVLDEVSPPVPSLRLRVAFGAAHGQCEGWEEWLARGAAVDRERVAERRRQVRPEDLSQIQFTSGTTGFPKGVELTNWTLANQGRHMAARAELRAGDSWVNPMPLFHCGGCVVAAMSLLAAGAKHLPLLRFDPQRVCDTIERERATFVSGVPTMLIALQEEVERHGQDLGSLRVVVSGGSLVPPPVAEHWQGERGNDFVITYGQTEFGPLVSVTSPRDSAEQQVTTCGRAIANVELDVVAPGSDERVPLGEEGEIRMRGFAMRGYHKDPEATAEVLNEEGWLRSGDLGRLDAEGYVYVTGRAKDMIIRGGENIAPASVEDAVRSLEGVADVSVIGVPDDLYGEELCAFVRLEADARLDVRSMRERLADRITRFKIPRYLVLLDAFPVTPSGKIQKFRLIELYQAAREEGTLKDGREPVAERP